MLGGDVGGPDAGRVQLQRRPAGRAGHPGIGPDGARKARRLTPLGWALLLRAADPA
jgi:hypothetical protein